MIFRASQRHFLRGFVSKAMSGRSVGRRKSQTCAVQLAISVACEALEVRRLLTTFNVTAPTGTSVGSLNSAINYANERPGTTIAFEIPGSSGANETIDTSAGLPSITADGTIINGTDTSTGGQIILNGHGLYLQASECTIENLQIENAGTGILITGGKNDIDSDTFFSNSSAGVVLDMLTAHDNSIQSSYIGTNSAGASRIGNGIGVVLQNGASNNFIGDSNGDENVICGNTTDGIQLSSDVSHSGNIFHIPESNAIEGNLIGVEKGFGGYYANPNGGDGIDIQSGVDSTLIGGDTSQFPNAANVIAGNTGNGIEIDSYNEDPFNPQGLNQISGNSIGWATRSFFNGHTFQVINNPNGGDGVYLHDGAMNNGIGGSSSGYGNVISGNDGAGVYIDDSSSGGNLIANNQIGVVGGNGAAGNKQYGIYDGGGGNGIDNNIVSGNGSGIGIYGTEDTVSGNLVGTDSTGTTAIPNNGDGIYVEANSTTVTGNTSSGNGDNGIGLIFGTGNVIEKNRVGTNSAGTAALSNGGTGVYVDSTGNDTISQNVISGNQDTGLWISGSAAHLSIFGNDIGTNAAGTAAIPNTFEGVFLDGADNITVGGTTAADRNIISGNSGYGVEIDDTCQDNSIIGNYIGLNAAGTGGIANASDGIDIEAPSDIVSSNVISGNGATGVRLTGTSATSNRLYGNYIGLNAAGTAAVPNASDGVIVIDGATKNDIGLSGNKLNTISGNTAYGVALSGAGTNGNYVVNNLIGTNPKGTAALANKIGGVAIVYSASQNIVGGSTSASRNIISGNGAGGVYVSGSGGTGTSKNAIVGNYIGVSITGSAAIGNGTTGAGIDVDTGASSTYIGAAVNGGGNVISGNSQAGIELFGGGIVYNNHVGTDYTGTHALGNGGDGILVEDNAATIGGTLSLQPNFIEFNKEDGVGVVANTSYPNVGGVAIRRNSIYSNSGLGINLAPKGEAASKVTLNDTLDKDTGPNTLQNFPVITSAVTTSHTVIAGTINSTASSKFTLEFFSSPSADASGYGEGQTYLGSVSVTTNSSGNASFTLSLTTTVPVGRWVVGTATNSGNSTSEFGKAVKVVS